MKSTHTTISCLLLASALASPTAAQARVAVTSLAELTERADAVAVVELLADGGRSRPDGGLEVWGGTLVETRLVSAILGSVDREIQFRYPLERDEPGGWLRPKAGLVLLVFLKRSGDEWHVVDGHQGMRAIQRPSAPSVQKMVRVWPKWASLTPGERRAQLSAWLRGKDDVRILTLMWIDELFFWDESNHTDTVLAGLILCARSANVDVRRQALGAIGTVARKKPDMVPYLVDALDDADLALQAAWSVDGVRGVRAKPADSPSPAARVARARQWWQTTGSKQIRFKRRTPKAEEQ